MTKITGGGKFQALLVYSPRSLSLFALAPDPDPAPARVLLVFTDHDENFYDGSNIFCDHLCRISLFHLFLSSDELFL